jgi:hypothetical protein
MAGQDNAPPRGGVPFLPEKRIEAEADLLLAEFGDRMAPVKSPAVPVERIAEVYLRLELEFVDMRRMFPEADVHGAIWFESRRIAIDQSLEPTANPSRLGRYRFTLAHEIGHWRLHRQHYLRNPDERRLFDGASETPDVACRAKERKLRVEWQADCFAACLLMPRQLVHAAWTAFRGADGRPADMAELRAARDGSRLQYRGNSATTEQERDLAVKEDFCRPLAAEFEVSAEAMRIRLEQLNLLVRRKEAMLF